jgi:hypothetical protein
MGDLLYQSAVAYQELMKYEYTFLIGRKMKAETIMISFPEERYHHLAGFQKVSFDSLKNRKTALERVLSGKPTHDDFQKAGYSLEDRWMGLCQLKEMIETNRFVFHYHKGKDVNSKIDADYFMINDACYFFILSPKPVSIFKNCDHSYATFGSKCATLQIWRREIQTDVRELLFQSLSFKSSNM